jgi:hypothetical protein
MMRFPFASSDLIEQDAHEPPLRYTEMALDRFTYKIFMRPLYRFGQDG